MINVEPDTNQIQAAQLEAVVAYDELLPKPIIPKILLVDDVRANLLLMKKVLGKMNAEIFMAESGEEALALTLRQEFAVVLMDVQMPIMDGIETASLIRNHDDTHHLPIVFMTGREKNDEYITLGYQVGGVDFLFKPINSQILISKVNVFLELYRHQKKLDVMDDLRNQIMIRKEAERALKEYSAQIEITNRKLEKANSQLRELDKLKSDFLAVASHELRTPLTIIREYVALIRDGLTGPINSEQIECLEVTLKNCDRLSSLINNILNLQRIESGRLKLRRRRVDITALVNSCLKDFRLKCQTKEQSLICSINTDNPYVLCDYDKLTQILVNLLSNAHKFTPIGGSITVRVGRDEMDNMKTAISVMDSGPGIIAEDQDRIFEKFTQLGREHGAGSQGTGLGLAIAQNIAGLHEGKIKIYSPDNKGSVFAFSISNYSEESELSAFVKDLLAFNIAEGNILSIFIVKIAERKSQKSKADTCNDGNLLEQIEKCVHNTLHRKDDETLMLPGMRLLVISANTNGTGSELFQKGMEEALSANIVDNVTLLITGGVITADDCIDDWIANKLEQFEPIGLAGKVKRVLVIDDEEVILNVISRALESSLPEIQIATSDDGYMGCLRFGEISPDLVILDVNMPGFDGAQVLKHIKVTNHWKNTKVMIISGSREKYQDFRDLGADEFLYKPLNLKELVEKTSALLINREDHAPIGQLQSVNG